MNNERRPRHLPLPRLSPLTNLEPAQRTVTVSKDRLRLRNYRVIGRVLERLNCLSQPLRHPSMPRRRQKESKLRRSDKLLTIDGAFTLCRSGKFHVSFGFWASLVTRVATSPPSAFGPSQTAMRQHARWWLGRDGLKEKEKKKYALTKCRAPKTSPIMGDRSLWLTNLTPTLLLMESQIRAYGFRPGALCPSQVLAQWRCGSQELALGMS